MSEPTGTLSTHDRFGFASGSPEIEVDDVLFRMLKPPEIGRAMAFGDAYVVLGTQREKVSQYGNAVTPPVAEVLFGAAGGGDRGCRAGGRRVIPLPVLIAVPVSLLALASVVIARIIRPARRPVPIAVCAIGGTPLRTAVRARVRVLVLRGVRPVRLRVLASVAVFPAVSTALALCTGGALAAACWVLAGLWWALWVILAARMRPGRVGWTAAETAALRGGMDMAGLLEATPRREGLGR